MNKINQYWKEGRYIDLWSLNHVLSGVVLASILFGFGVSFVTSVVIAFVLFVGWEVAEVALGIKEHTPNMVMDVVCDFAGFFGIAYRVFILDNEVSLFATLGWIALFMVFNIWGFFAYEVRKIEKI